VVLLLLLLQGQQFSNMLHLIHYAYDVPWAFQVCFYEFCVYTHTHMCVCVLVCVFVISD
jgi:hypothetical protein